MIEFSQMKMDFIYLYNIFWAPEIKMSKPPPNFKWTGAQSSDLWFFHDTLILIKGYRGGVLFSPMLPSGVFRAWKQQG